MKTIRDYLEEFLPSILPNNPDKAIGGTELIKLVKDNPDFNDENDSTLRIYFSSMASDSTSVLAKRVGKHGYYLRPKEILSIVDTESLSKTEVKKIEHEEEVRQKRDEQNEEKFRSVFIKYYEQNSSTFAMKVEHTRGKKEEKGLNKWKYPDVTMINWEVGELKQNEYRLNTTLLEVRKSLGEQPFRLSSVELKTELRFSNFREHFFQCLSNSKWAHGAILAVASDINDSKLQEELTRLGNSYEITILSFGLTDSVLESLPDADIILGLSQTEFEKLAEKINVTIITTGKERDTLDWEHIRDLRIQNTDFQDLFDWISKCLSVGKAYKYSDFKELRKIENNYA
jgi:hypothetical protein